MDIYLSMVRIGLGSYELTGVQRSNDGWKEEAKRVRETCSSIYTLERLDINDIDRFVKAVCIRTHDQESAQTDDRTASPKQVPQSTVTPHAQ